MKEKYTWAKRAGKGSGTKVTLISTSKGGGRIWNVEKRKKGFRRRRERCGEGLGVFR